MLKKKFFAVIAAVCMAAFLTGCETNAAAEETARESVTAAEQTEQAAETTAETTQSVTETQTETADFVYPDDPLTAENLLKITTAAKVQLIESEEISGNMIFHFGLLDIDFDGLPEMFCEFRNPIYHYFDCSLYSLKEENFCEKLVDYQAHFDSTVTGNSVYLQKGEYVGEKSIIVYSNWSNNSHGVSSIISEIKNTDGNFSFEEKFRSHWDYISPYDSEYKYEPDFFYIDGEETDWENYEKRLMEYWYCSNNITPIEYVHENVRYGAIEYGADPYKITMENYDELYSLYSVYVNNLKKQGE